ncbi:hypothetical protein [Ereboglobus luteus]|nr:hypothetical protein [Ereboglobus luteus]
MPRFLEQHHRMRAVVIAAACFLIPHARACGPDFPNAYLAEGSVSLLSAPEGYFAAEIEKIAPRKKAAAADSGAALVIAANKAKRENELTETGVLRIELARRGYAQERIDALAGELESARAVIFAKDWASPPVFSGDMPAEFALYLNGAFAYWKGDHETADNRWKTLLALPADERRHYTVNAAYMLGRLCVPDAQGEGIPERQSMPVEAMREMLHGVKWFQQTRDAAEAGFDDISDLAQASLGWEARAHFFNGYSTEAIHLYLRQHAAGDRRGAVLSLRAVARDAFESAESEDGAKHLRQLARDEKSRRVLTLYLLARFGLFPWFDDEAGKKLDRQSRIWAGILDEAELRDVPDTDRLAWLAYQAGYFDLAAQWLKSASASSVPANWIRAKLALRSGDAARAGGLLEKVTSSPELTGGARPVAWADLGRVRMGAGKYAGALDAFLRGGHWQDCAYIAERVLVLDELVAFVDKHCPQQTGTDERQFFSVAEEREEQDEKALRNELRHLLARRLARANKPEDARAYFPEKLRQIYAAYVDDVRAGFNGERAPGERAKAFWNAAASLHENGMALLGTELAPDYSIWGGNFEWSPIAGARRDKLRREGGLGAPTADELQRVEAHAVPRKRFHYRYRAADLGWWAASLMPNDSDETARMLNTAGGWIKKRDPGEANRFYRALVIRCPNTVLGKQAAARNWFPE